MYVLVSIYIYVGRLQVIVCLYVRLACVQICQGKLPDMRCCERHKSVSPIVSPEPTFYKQLQHYLVFSLDDVPACRKCIPSSAW